ncbi:hypothetical protein Cgig2_018944 [Carnegiea gigantea]|uniref:Peroxisomal membrane protein 2 n=1 Tax=Carnegiea gigantea TaxID=171969 RepID=A0A9Q1JHE0_9CARY|nr:hypothetical protein Cgig2_018944 [Carnegiea gigantea]
MASSSLVSVSSHSSSNLSMASLNSISRKTLSPLSKPLKPPAPRKPLNLKLNQCPAAPALATTWLRRPLSATAKELDVPPVQSPHRTDHADMTMGEEREAGDCEGELMVGHFEGRLSVEGVGGGGRQGNDKEGQKDVKKLIDRVINATIVLAAGSFAVTKLLTIDHDYWHGWTLYEILRYAPQHNWTAYEEILKTNPIFAKMVISGVVYSLGDWIAQCYEGKPLFDFDRARMFRSGVTGFCLHGSLSHFYYEFCEAGWKLWPFAHLVTYGVIPVEQRLLWVDCVELIWVTILSTYSNEKSEARISEASAESTSSKNPLEV